MGNNKSRSVNKTELYQKMRTDIAVKFDTEFATTLSNKTSQDCSTSVVQCNEMGNLVIKGNNNNVSQQNEAKVSLQCLMNSSSNNELQQLMSQAFQTAVQQSVSADVLQQVAQKASNGALALGSNNQSSSNSTVTQQDVLTAIKQEVNNQISTSVTDEVLNTVKADVQQCNKMKNVVIIGDANKVGQKNSVVSVLSSETMKTTVNNILNQLDTKFDLKSSSDAAAKISQKSDQTAENKGVEAIVGACCGGVSLPSSCICTCIVIVLVLLMLSRGGSKGGGGGKA